MNRFLLSFALVLFLLPGCGFTPLYGTGAKSISNADGLNSVKINNIPDREGQILRNLLIDRFYKTGAPANPDFELAVGRIEESITDLDITKSSDATRAQLRLTTSFDLVSRNTQQVVMNRELTSITSYNILQSQFTTRVSEQDARESALNELARQIELQVMLYLDRSR